MLIICNLHYVFKSINDINKNTQQTYIIVSECYSMINEHIKIQFEIRTDLISDNLTLNYLLILKTRLTIKQ